MGSQRVRSNWATNTHNVFPTVIPTDFSLTWPSRPSRVLCHLLSGLWGQEPWPQEIVFSPIIRPPNMLFQTCYCSKVLSKYILTFKSLFKVHFLMETFPYPVTRSLSYYITFLLQLTSVNFLMFKLALEKAEEPEIKLPTSAGSWKKQESSRKTSISALLTMPQ